ncbi:D-alanyl-D-alanine carboxypeptidase [Caldalkalibacillus thermarum]
MSSHLLYMVQEEPWFDVFLGSLTVAGISERMVGGTLRNRMRDTAAAGNVRAKTGSLTSKTSLCGYVTTADGHPLTFQADMPHQMLRRHVIPSTQMPIIGRT